ncbi:hypothetical protein [Providencia sp. NPDC089923]|uniref:hypothetical protein n=1 Tax=Providencia sp. NPDC089923 TaxID=3415004 RepID=UPI003C2EF8F2
MNISKMLKDSVELYGKEFVTEQKALRSEKSRQESIEAYKNFEKNKKTTEPIKKKKGLVHALSK